MFRFLDASDADGRMGQLERFLEFWYGPRLPAYGEPDAASLQPALPAPLLRFYE